jgi:hypothetical protein
MKKCNIMTISFILVFFVSSILNANDDTYNATSFIMKGAKAEEDQKYKEAVLFYLKALDLNPRIVELYKKVGYIYQYELNDIDKAIEIYLKGLEYKRNDYAMNLSIMHAYFIKGDLYNGIKHYKILSAIRKDNQRYSFPRKVLDSMTKKMTEEQIIDFSKKYLAINPTDVILRNILADIYMRKGKYEMAKEQFNSMLDFGYIDGKGYFGLAVCNYYLGEYEESLNNFAKSKELGEDVPEEYIDMVKKKINNVVDGKEQGHILKEKIVVAS